MGFVFGLVVGVVGLVYFAGAVLNADAKGKYDWFWVKKLWDSTPDAGDD